MENIGKFLDACSYFSMKPTDLFQTVDLYEGANIPQVRRLWCQLSLHLQCVLVGYQFFSCFGKKGLSTCEHVCVHAIV